ncbi:helix-turn-helix domain-containing protein [Amycolatopsis sp. NPDC006131]|uniref:TetR/AcrR family transcriptional regulator n=1 Tax=Amycolatopsis sp. NPDC006131 TaxID=3156731 RepID=UPI0033A029E9
MERAPSPSRGKIAPRFDRTSAAILDAAARVFSEEGAGANLATVALAAGISRATLYRYYANREALLEALTADALDAVARRLVDANLERATVEEAIERILRAFVAVGDRYAVLTNDQATLEAAHGELAAPLHEVLTRGIETGVLRDDLPVEILYEFLAGTILKAIALNQQHRLGLEEASATAASFFLNGTRSRD